MESWTKEVFLQRLENGEKGAFYLYTPLCGTCQLAGKMLSIAEEMLPELPIGKADLNYMADLAKMFYIESVPCLILFKNGEIKQKIYAFQSVPHLYDQLKNL